MKLFATSVRLILAASIVVAPAVFAQEPSPDESGGAIRGSLVEDRAAAKLLEAGDGRLEADEPAKAVEVWESVIERYPRSKVRFTAHMRLGNFQLERERAFDKARVHFEAAANEDNGDQEQRAEAVLKMGICFYEARNFGKCFTVMRDVIEQFPVSPQVNQAYYYIGLGHFQEGHYSRAIDALDKVGTTLSGNSGRLEKVEAGKRLFITVDDADLAALESGRTVQVTLETGRGDKETADCVSVGRNVRVVMGSILTVLGTPVPGNGRLEVHGDDQIRVTYVDEHTGDRQFNRSIDRQVPVVGNAVVQITDGAFSEALRGVVLDKPANLQIIDSDHDVTGGADRLTAVVEAYRDKTPEEIEAESAGAPATTTVSDEDKPQVAPRKLIDRVEVEFSEAAIRRSLPMLPQNEPSEPAAVEPSPEAEEAAATKPAADPVDADDGSIHSGVFRAFVPLQKSEVVDASDDVLQALPGDWLQVTYVDRRNTGEGARTVIADARMIEGNLGGVRVTRAQISDQELLIQTRLKTASALTNIGNRYKEFGLKKNADAKYDQALGTCEEVMAEAKLLGGRMLEDTYVQLWQIYYEMDRLELAGKMAQRLLHDFPNSGFADDALLMMADTVRKQGDKKRAIGLYNQLVHMPNSQLRGEAQFGVAECYEEMAAAAPAASAKQLFDQAFQEYKKVYDLFPDSGRVGEAVAKMANFYYQQQDYSRAIDIFETVLGNHPDAKFLDVIIFNYGRCLYRMDRKAEARRQFDQLIAEFPESPLAGDAKRVAEALAQAGF